MDVLSALYLAREFSRDKKNGIDMYIKMCEIGCTMDYNDAIKHLGLKSAFSEEVIMDAAEYLKSP